MNSLDQLDVRTKNFAFSTALLVNFIDQLGGSFLIPVVIPIGEYMGASVQQIANFGLVRGFFLFFSTVWMSRLSDLTSRRLAIFLSLFGSAVAYGLQASATSFLGVEGSFLGMSFPVLVFTIGRAIAGFFAGTSPVLRAFVSDLYANDSAALKQNLVTLQVVSQGLGLALSPIAGSITLYYSLETPFYISCFAAILGVLWTLAFFPVAGKKELAQPVVGSAEPQTPGPTTSVDGPKKNPYCDGTVLMFSAAFVCMATLFIGTMGLLVPQMLLRTPGFGIDIIEDKEEQSKKLAQALGLLSLPNGLASTFTSIFLYTRLTERFGELIPLAAAGLIASCTFPFYGMTTTMWQLYICSAVVGSSMGMVFPAVGPLMAKYALVAYPEQKAQVQAIPMMGMSIGMTIGQNIMALVIDTVGIANGFWFSSCVMLVGITVLVTGVRRVSSVIDSMDRHKKFEDAIGDDPVAYAEKVGKLVTEYLVKHKDEMTNRPIQKLVLAKMVSAVPTLPEWDSKTNGEAYLGALWEECDRFADVSEEFAKTFKDAGVKGVHISAGAETFFEEHCRHHQHGAHEERRRSRKGGFARGLSAGATVELEEGLTDTGKK